MENECNIINVLNHNFQQQSELYSDNDNGRIYIEIYNYQKK